MESSNKVHFYQQRRFGLLEKYQLSKHLTHAYGNITLTAHLKHRNMLSDQGEPTYERYKEHYLNYLQTGLAQLIGKHPMLSLVVREKDRDTVHFAQLSQINLEEVITIDLQHRNLQDNIQQVIQQETDREFDLDSMQLPLWRLRIVVGLDITTTTEECLLVLTMHHVIGDGMSLTIFMKELLSCISTSRSFDDNNNSSRIVNINKIDHVPPPYELAGAPSLSILWDIMPVLYQNLMPKVLPTNLARYLNPLSYESWKGDFPAVKEEPHHTVVQLFNVPAEVWKPTIQEAKKRGISAHAILYTCYLKTWSAIYADDDNCNITEVCTPINCRSICKPSVPKDWIGNYVSSYTSIWKKKEDNKADIWERAKQYYQDLHKNMHSSAKQTLFLKFLPEFPDSYCEFWYDKRRNSSFGRTGGLELSDLGKLVLLTDQRRDEDNEDEASNALETVEVKHVYFCQSAQIFTNVISLNSISLNDQLYCTLSYQKGSVKQDKINHFNSVFVDILKSLKL
ncbi:hypothetical protein BDF20DRAFT_889142 [Mycotypha africana]|uniref:uncharacterized protein n=1 Tax=Mycotypha africana TaxID=64632 RepID=UPI0023017AB1|nr:uncharacterized protein BDF20DRAFT_889142 [Mycotypha africana]KAI8970069.1 hypothetical protein BDF20DRAFT_889142 [Mycotypha africana]